MTLRLISLVLLLIGPVALLHADALMVNQSMWSPAIAEYFISEDGVDVEIEIGLKGTTTFKNLLPDAIYSSLGYGERPVNERREEFFTRQLVLVDENEQILQGELLAIGPARKTLRDAVNGTPLPIQEGAPEIIRAVLHYAFNGDVSPKQLTFYAPVNRNIGFVVYHKGVAVNDFRYLVSGYRLDLNWADPWYSAFDGRKLRRQNYAPMSGFIYIEPFEVRKEIIARPKDLQRWLDLGLEGKTTISVDMQDQIKRKVADFLSLHHPVKIDGAAVTGIFSSINFLERTMTSSRVIDPPEELNINAAILGAIFVYPQKSLPENVEMEWDLWDERIQSIPAVAVDEVGPFTSVLEPDWAILRWENFLKDPFVPGLRILDVPADTTQTLLARILMPGVFMLVLASAWLGYALYTNGAWFLPAGALILFASITLISALRGQANNPETEQAQRIVGDLLHNVYRSFDYREESDIYDKLAHSVSGELITDIYLEAKRSLVLANQGGASAKVKDVTVQSLELLPSTGDNWFSAEVNWTVNGSVGHWGHIHQRSNRYQAVLDIVVDQQQWKLQKMTVLQEERL